MNLTQTKKKSVLLDEQTHKALINVQVHVQAHCDKKMNMGSVLLFLADYWKKNNG
jgi:hypothetical protein